MKLWHDDVRPNPSGWVWAKDNTEAKKLLRTGTVTIISMDHDLGSDPNEGIFARGSSEDNGMRLTEWMIEYFDGKNYVVPEIIIHSWNPQGAISMANAFNDAGFNVTIEPYSVSS